MSEQKELEDRKPCDCGCGEYPKLSTSRFLPGHDLRKAYSPMTIDVDAELRESAKTMEVAMNALRKTGFTNEQLEQLDRYVHAALAHTQYAILKAGREIRSESAFQPGEFQTKVL